MRITTIMLSLMIVFIVLSSYFFLRVYAGGTRVLVIVNHHEEENVRICVYSDAENLGCRTIDLSNRNNPFESSWQFSPGSVPLDKSFTACVENLDSSDSQICNGGENTSASPDSVSIEVPTSSNGNGNGGLPPFEVIVPLMAVIVAIVIAVLMYIIKKMRSRNTIESSKEKE